MNDEINKIIEDINLDKLSLIDPALFIFAAQSNQKFAEVLIKPVMEEIEIEDYRVYLTNFDILENFGLKYTPVLSSAVITEDGERLIIDIVNIPNYNQVEKRLRAIRSLNDYSFVEKNDGDYNKLPEVITVCYTEKQIGDSSNKNPVSTIYWKDLINSKNLSKFPEFILINNEYKNQEDQNFIKIVEDLAETNLENIKNPILKDIHLKAKETEEGRNKLLKIVEKFEI